MILIQQNIRSQHFNIVTKKSAFYLKTQNYLVTVRIRWTPVLLIVCICVLSTLSSLVFSPIASSIPFRKFCLYILGFFLALAFLLFLFQNFVDFSCLLSHLHFSVDFQQNILALDHSLPSLFVIFQASNYPSSTPPPPSIPHRHTQHQSHLPCSLSSTIVSRILLQSRMALAWWSQPSITSLICQDWSCRNRLGYWREGETQPRSAKGEQESQRHIEPGKRVTWQSKPHPDHLSFFFFKEASAFYQATLFTPTPSSLAQTYYKTILK